MSELYSVATIANDFKKSWPTINSDSTVTMQFLTHTFNIILLYFSVISQNLVNTLRSSKSGMNLKMI